MDFNVWQLKQNSHEIGDKILNFYRNLMGYECLDYLEGDSLFSCVDPNYDNEKTNWTLQHEKSGGHVWPYLE